MRIHRGVLAVNDSIAQKWLDLVATYDYLDSPRSRIEAIASQYREGQPCQVIQRIQGAFNYCFRVRFDDEGRDDWIVRFPVPGFTMDPLRKTRDEVAVMSFVQSNTMIPTAKLIGSGVAGGEFDGLGPYIIMEYVRGFSLDELILEDNAQWSLKKDLPSETIETIYRQIANIYLELHQHSFPQIGSLALSANASAAATSWRVTSGPLTFKMNEVERMGGVLLAATDKPYTSATSYYQALAEQSQTHLANNPNVGRDEQEVHNDREAIHKLQSLAEHFGNNSNTSGRNKLFCDDLRFGNILVDEAFRIVAVLDWEFCYVAPQSFLCSPPSWLIGSEPFEWKQGDVDFFKDQVRIFLRLVEEEEDRRQVERDLSRAMQRAMRDGAFWYNLAVRESFPLSDIIPHFHDMEAFQNGRLD